MALSLGGKTSRVAYLNERCSLVAGKTAHEAVGTLVPNSKGGKSRYTNADLQYDLKGGRLSLKGNATPAVGLSKSKSRVNQFVSPAAPSARKGKAKKKQQKLVKETVFMLKASDPKVQGHDECMDAISEAAGNIESKFVASGRIKGNAVKLTTGTEEICFPMSSAKASKQLKPLLDAATPSPFGRGNQTVHDSSVRVASQLLPSDFEVDFDPKKAGVLETIRQQLVPDTSEVRAELHKLNIYGEGGFFAKHKDTPRSTTNFGSLVVVLPVPFEGGSLKVGHNGQLESFDWARTMQHGWNLGYRSSWDKEKARKWDEDKAKKVPLIGVQWAAFFGDAEHEVLKVTKGHRITLTYLLHRAPLPEGAPPPDVLVQRAVGLQESLRASLTDPTFMADGGELGFRCRHLYEESALAKTEEKLGSGGQTDIGVKQLKQLKNEDAVVALAAASFGLEVSCLRMLEDGEGYMDDGPFILDKMPKKKDAKRFGCMRYVDGGWKTMTVTPDEVHDYTEGSVSEHCSIEWVEGYDSAKKAFAERQYGEYFGNEACHSTFYISAAIVVSIPAAEERQKQLTLSTEPLTVARVRGTATVARGAATATAAAANSSSSSSSTWLSASASSSSSCSSSSSSSSSPSSASARPSSSKRKRSTVNYAEADSGDDGSAYSDNGDEEEEEEEEDEDDGGAGGKGKGKGKGKGPKAQRTSSKPAFSVSAPPSLFAADASGASASADLNRERTIHVVGGEGNARCQQAGGKCDVVLAPGEGLRELKVRIRKAFGKAPWRKMGSLMLVDAGAGGSASSASASASGSRKAESKHLVHGATVRCTYSYASGNAFALRGGRRGRGYNVADHMVMAMLMSRGHLGMFGGAWYSDDEMADY